MTAQYPTIPGVQFKDIDGFPGYCIGDDGSVWSRRNNRWGLSSEWRRLVIRKNPRGYPAVNLWHVEHRTFKAIHILLLECFVGPRPDGMQACHRNDDRDDNRLENLYWGTKHDNARDAIRNGRMARGQKHAMSKLTEADILEIRRRIDSGEKSKSVAQDFNIGRSYASAIGRRDEWKWLPG